ncbi:MAG: hypothetical protein AAB368_12805 [bacterium]
MPRPDTPREARSLFVGSGMSDMPNGEGKDGVSERMRPAVPAPASCPVCRGVGFVTVTDSRVGLLEVACPRCLGEALATARNGAGNRTKGG